MFNRPFATLLAAILTLPLTLAAQQTEAAIPGFSRTSASTITLLLPTVTGKPKPLILSDFDFNGDFVDTEKLHLRLIAPGVYELTSLAYDTGYWHFTVADAASYYGTGERFDTLDRAHTIVHNLATDFPGPKGSTTSKPIPFFLSTNGYGLWVDAPGDATFDFNTTDRTHIAIDVTSNRLRLILFTGSAENPGRFPDILDAFTKQTQRAILPPYWAFAPWHGLAENTSQADVLQIIERTRQLGLPASGILIDAPWATGSNSYIPNPKQFDDFPGLSQNLHANGFKLVLEHSNWIKSQANNQPASPNYAEAADRNFFVRNRDGSPWIGSWSKGQGSLIDFTNPKAKQWWQDQVRLAITAGADGLKDDEGTFPSSDVRLLDGSDPRMMRNRYATLYNTAVEELIQHDLKGNGVLFAHSVTAGSNGIGFLWGGDGAANFSPADGLPTVVTAGLSAGLSGMPLWSADVGGSIQQAGTPNPTLLQRWTEFAAFSPVMEVTSSSSLASAPALDSYRKYSILHMSLFPYRYAAAQQAALHGTPMLRALIYDFQDDPAVRPIKDEYLFGPSLLVAPVLDQNTSRPVYLPAGTWLDLATGQQFTGPQTILAPAPLDTIPVYARLGTILPKIPEDIMTLVPAAESGNTQLHTLDNRRIFEVLGPAAPTPTTITDFESRTLTRTDNTLTITSDKTTPANTHIILRFRFLTPHTATVNGTQTPIHPDATGIPTLEFDLPPTTPTTITWQ